MKTTKDNSLICVILLFFAVSTVLGKDFSIQVIDGLIAAIWRLKRMKGNTEQVVQTVA